MISIWGMTDVGLVRKDNQDAYLIAEHEESGRQICVVCDGMGGAAGGQVASRLASEVFVEELKKALTAEMTPSQLVEASSFAAAKANRAILEAAKKDETLVGMGTTLVGAVTCDGGVVITNIGDSRA